MFKVISGVDALQLEAMLNAAYADGYRMVVGFTTATFGADILHTVILKKAAV